MHDWRGEELAGLRHGLYRLFAASLLYPDRELLACLRLATTVLDKQELSAFPFYEPWVALREALRGRLDLRRLENQYVRLFSVSAGDSVCPPFESHYAATLGQPTALVLLRIEQEYSWMGLSISSEHGSLPDHASAEMEAMAFLCCREAEEWRKGELEDALETLGNEHSFLDGHLARWFPTFVDRVKEAGERTFYVKAVSAADAFLRHDHDLLGLILKETSEVA